MLLFLNIVLFTLLETMNLFCERVIFCDLPTIEPLR